jgi:hypothetical protein
MSRGPPCATGFPVSNTIFSAGEPIPPTSAARFSGLSPPHPEQFSCASTTPPSSAIRTSSFIRRNTSLRHAGSARPSLGHDMIRMNRTPSFLILGAERRRSSVSTAKSPVIFRAQFAMADAKQVTRKPRRSRVARARSKAVSSSWPTFTPSMLRSSTVFQPSSACASS